MVNYNIAKIYKIHSKRTGNDFYGSTCSKTLAHRLATHRHKYKLFINEHNDFFVECYELFKNSENDDDVRILLVENVPCKNKDELNARLQYYISSNDCLNKERLQ
jgi:hypothetical protein